MLYQVERQHTAGAYKPIITVDSHEKAVAYLVLVAQQNPEYPYDGSDTYKVGRNVHNITRYRITEIKVL